MILRAALLLSAAILPMTGAECSGMRRVPVYLAVNAPIDGAAVAAAREEAGWILRSLCALVEWREAESSDTLLIRILPEPVSSGSSADALGLAMPNLGRGNRGAVFLARIRERVEASGGTVGLPILLGSVIAHEAGHLLLRSKAHSSEGVMVADYGKREMAKAAQRHLVFTAEDRAKFALVEPGAAAGARQRPGALGRYDAARLGNLALGLDRQGDASPPVQELKMLLRQPSSEPTDRHHRAGSGVASVARSISSTAALRSGRSGGKDASLMSRATTATLFSTSSAVLACSGDRS
jgi:hypothetical protein